MIGKPKYHNGEMAKPTAVRAICAMVRGIARGSSVAAATVAAEGETDAGGVVAAAGRAEAFAVELAATGSAAAVVAFTLNSDEMRDPTAFRGAQ